MIKGCSATLHIFGLVATLALFGRKTRFGTKKVRTNTIW